VNERMTSKTENENKVKLTENRSLLTLKQKAHGTGLPSGPNTTH
jgi:hypothetical protein